MIAFERIKELAKNKKMTLVEVNDKAELGKRSIYNWKNRKPGIMALGAVAKVLHTSTDYLSGITDDPVPHIQKSIHLEDDLTFVYHGYSVPQKYIDAIRFLMDHDIKSKHWRL